MTSIQMTPTLSTAHSRRHLLATRCIGQKRDVRRRLQEQLLRSAFCVGLLFLSGGHGRADDDVFGAREIDIHSPNSPVLLYLQSDNPSPILGFPGMSLGYFDSTSATPTASAVFSLYRPAGQYQWEFTTVTASGNTERLAMQLGNDHSLSLFDPNGTGHITLHPGTDENSGVYWNGSRLATESEIIGSYLPVGVTILGNGAFSDAWSGVAIGDNAETNPDSIAIGSSSVAGGSLHIAIGYGARTVDSGLGYPDSMGATAVGLQAYAQGRYSLALGDGAVVGDFATVIGNSSSYGWASFSAGWGMALADGSISISGYTDSGAWNSTAIAGGTTTNYHAVAIGQGTWAFSPFQVVVGCYNEIPVEFDNYWNAQPRPVYQGGTDSPLFVVGNGADGARSNAFAVAWNGNTKIQGTVTVQGGVGEGRSIFQGNVHVQGVLRVPAAGDIGMGDFHTGTDPQQP